jgi:tetratricopeptide (TPR) repeat protein
MRVPAPPRPNAAATMNRTMMRYQFPRYLLIVFPLILGNCSAWRGGALQNQPQAMAALRSGAYAAAREYFETALKVKPGQEENQLGFLQTLYETGAYEQAARLADSFLTAKENSAPLHLLAGRIAEARGDYEPAEKRYRRAVALSGTTRIEANRRLADLLRDLGRRTEADRIYDAIIEEYRKGSVRSSRDFGHLAVAAWRRDYIEDAKNFFIDATDGKKGEPELEALSDFGALFLEKFVPKEALGVYRDCLTINQAYPSALVGMALGKQYDSDSEAEKYALAALAVNPNLIPALDLVAELRIQEEDYGAGLAQIQRALAVNPRSLEALSLLAACHYLSDDRAAFEETEKKVLAINPNCGRLYYTLAENMMIRRKYQESVDFNRKAIALDSKLWAAYNSLGMNLTRIGDLAGGRKAIQQAFDGDSYNMWAYNSLEMLDQLDGFVLSQSPHFTFRIAKEDQPALAPYAPPLAEEAYDKLTKRYGFTPSVPLHMEIFPDHGGFSVRTLGLPTLGAVGVCFGKVVAMDSPRVKDVGPFNWGSTLWHEFTHVITLQMTNHNIPRWYSEGLSVYEERRARPGWGDHMTLGFLKAYSEGKLLKVSELNSGMMRPKFPEQVLFSYYQASLVCDLIEQKFGFDKIRQSLLLFAQNKPAEEVFRESLGWDFPTLDREFAKFLESRVMPVSRHVDLANPGTARNSPQGAEDRATLSAALARDPDNFQANWRMGILLRHEKDLAGAELHLKRAEKVFPEFVDPENPYQVLGEMFVEQKREDEALGQYLEWARNDSETVEPLRRAGEIYRKRKAWSAMSDLLELSVYVNPYETSMQSLLGEAAAEAGNWTAAVSAYQAIVGLDPVDPAEAHFNLARALLGSGRKTEAKREVLRSLEIAPNFEKAQQLLLKINGGVS